MDWVADKGSRQRPGRASQKTETPRSMKTSNFFGSCLLPIFGLVAAGLSLARADVVIVETRLKSGQNSCPPYCELYGNWGNSSIKSSAAGLDGGRPGSRYATQASSFSIQPTLGEAGGHYYVEVTHATASSISADIVVSIATEGGGGLPETTTGFQRTNGVNEWFRIGTIDLNPGVTQPTITFSHLSGATSRTYADAFRFVNTNDVCLMGLPQLTTVNGPLAAGQTFVNVPAVNSNAQKVTVYAFDGSAYTQLGELAAGVIEGVNVVPTVPLVKRQVIVATQWKDGIESCKVTTGPFVGGGANPQLRLSLSIADTAPTNHVIGASGSAPLGSHLVFLKADGTVDGAFGVAPTGGLALTPSTCWQHISFDRASDPLFGWSGAYGNSWLSNDWAVLDAIAFCVQDTQDSGPFSIYIDNFMNGTNLIEDFESYANGETAVLITKPSQSGSTSTAPTPYLLAPPPGAVSPDECVVVSTNVASGNRCLFMSWQFKDDSNQDWLRATFQGQGKPFPIVDLRQPISFDVLLLPVGQTQGHFVNVGTVENQRVFETQDATFSVVPTGPGAFTYQWSLNGFDLPGATASAYAVVHATAADAGVYTVKVHDGTCPTERSAVLTVLSPVPTITNQPVSLTVYLTQDATFSAAASGNVPSGYPVTYQWRFYGGDIFDATNATLTIRNAQSWDAGPYDVVASNPYGPSASAEVTLTVLDPVPAVTNQPVRTVVHVGETGNFQVGADGHVEIGYPLSYQWRFNGLDLPGQTSAALSVPNAQIANSGFYDVVVANMYGSVTSVVAVLDVLAPGVVPGAGAGLSGSYYNNPEYTEDAPPSPFDGAPALSRVDPAINFDWLEGAPGSPVATNYFAARWSGQIEPLGAGTYTFYTTTDDGVRLWVGGQLVINQWIPQSPTEWSGTLALPNAKSDLVLEYYEKTGGAVAKLSWSATGIPKQPVPQSQLYPLISRPVLGVERSGADVILRWDTPHFTLQTATNVLGAYVPVSGATSPHTNAIGPEPQRFFRLSL